MARCRVRSKPPWRKQSAIEMFAPETVTDYTTDAFAVTAKLGRGGEIAARLLVAADGKRSRLRDRAGIKCVAWSYPQIGIVTTVAHQQAAWRARRAAFPARRSVRHAAADRQPLIHRVDRRR